MELYHVSPERSRGRRWAAPVGSWAVTVMDRLCCPGLQGITTVLLSQVMDSNGHGPNAPGLQGTTTVLPSRLTDSQFSRGSTGR